MSRYVTCSLPGTRCFAATVPAELEVRVGAACVVEFNGGPELCRVRTVLDAEACGANGGKPPGRVVRLATREDEERGTLNETLADEALRQFDREVDDAPQGVHAVLARFNLDRSRLVLIYHADQRFDARRAAASLNRRYRAAVEARQVGIRDEAAVLGGIGSCGRAICCATWLRNFQPVNVRMAKAQDLSLNPNAINGSCGRLKCCLRYELERAPETDAGDEEGET
jgi:cell fate regulator YaaT (PSP1 superfamily)